MSYNVKKRAKVSHFSSKRKQRMVCLVSDEEKQIIDDYLKRYNINNKGRWFREVLLTFIHKNIEDDYPTLFKEHDMRR